MHALIGSGTFRPILAIWLLLTPIEFWRARREDRALRETFGEEYERYKARTWF